MSATNHWTSKSAEDLQHKIAFDFLTFIEKAMGDELTQAQLAERLNVSEDE